MTKINAKMLLVQHIQKKNILLIYLFISNPVQNCKLKPKVIVGNGHTLIKPKYLNQYNKSLSAVSDVPVGC
jgi:hypothetical protein